MDNGLAILNKSRNAFCLATRNDPARYLAYKCRMAVPEYDWYFREWLAYFGKKQRDVVSDLEWNKSKVSLMAAGKQPYTREEVNEIAAYLSLRPYELLMHPDDAMALRALRSEAMKVVTQTKRFDDPTEEFEKRDGTHG
ncbi:hypothetical protein [Sphingomonas sp. 2378]|uniref:hypothetical protein n=1 Tax=Sphingomonas sp. 2378 TaxID=1219748 RepID=UPI00311B3AF6